MLGRHDQTVADIIERKLGDMTSLLARARQEAAKWGSTFEGDADEGRYTFRTPMGAIEGTYTVTRGTIRFVLEKKPRLLPQAVIERVLDEFLGTR